MPSWQKYLSVGTTPIVGLQANPKRIGWRILMISQGIEAGNIGRVHIGKNFPPGTVLGNPNIGDMLTQSSQLSETIVQGFPETCFKGDIWLVASQADQRVLIEENFEA